jgi:hypothetical protein
VWIVGLSSSANTIIIWASLAAGTRSWALLVEPTKLAWYWSVNGSTDQMLEVAVPGNTWVLNQWYHVAATRTGGKLYLFQDGVLLNVGGTAHTICYYGTINNQAVHVPLTIGKFGDYYNASHAHYGYIDEIRICKGIAQWTDDFTPAVSAYSI